MSVKALADYTQYAKYARYLPEKKRRETWNEQVDRVFDMHEKHLGAKLELIREEFNFAKEMLKKKRILGSQRALQFGGNPILKHQAKIYNCSAAYVDKVDFFKECMYLLLCGCGVGFSVQKHHIAKLPTIKPRDKGKTTFVIPDSIEGWSDAIGVLMQSYFRSEEDYYVYDVKTTTQNYSGYEIEFDYSMIRPQGTPISWGGKAPGAEGLKNAITNITMLLDTILKERQETNLKPIEAYDIIMHTSDSVISGGIRRSACIALFSVDDEEMYKAKTGDWFIKNPQRGRSNNSAVLLRNGTTKEQFSKLMKSVKEFGEPGFIWTDSLETLFNPCSEISFYNYDENGNSGFGFCNLTEINGKKAKTEQDFYDACRASAILGTIQATYDSFNYLSKVTENIVKRDALLGVSITGMMDNPDIIFNEKIQQNGAKIVLDVNKEIAEKLGINPCVRATCVKPSGSASCILGTSSGIHPSHARRYLRRVQANKLEFPVQHFATLNPTAVEESVWSNNNTDLVITFLCEVPDGAKTKNQMNAIELLEHVKLSQQNWVEYGTRTERNDEISPWLRHNISNTISVGEQEWDIVENYIFQNRKWFAGISLLSGSGDLDYPQAPFVTILNEKELVQTYGQGTVFASGLIVDGLKAFNNNLWSACDTAIGIGEFLTEMVEPKEPLLPLKNGYTNKEWSVKLTEYAEQMTCFDDDFEQYQINTLKMDWVRRFKQFAERYCEGNLRKCSHMLKHVYVWKKWIDLKRDYVDIDWSTVEEDHYDIDVSELSGQACGGGACDISASLSASIKEKTTKTKVD
jgi:ribonucleoside-diphosphate reductase alpha chain